MAADDKLADSQPKPSAISQLIEANRAMLKVIELLRQDLGRLTQRVADVEKRLSERFGPPVLNCPKCTRKISTYSKVCKFCGTRVGEELTPTHRGE